MIDIDFEERAAIIEYDGGLSRREAEFQARRIIDRQRQPQPALFDEE